MGPVPAGSTTGRFGASRGPSPISVFDIQSEARRLLNASLAPNTVKAYSTGLKTLHKFRQRYSLSQNWPPSVQELTMFIAYLSLCRFSFKSVALYIAAISFQCKIDSREDTTKHFVVSKALEGLRRTAKSKRSRLPITIELLEGILTKLSAVCRDSYETALFSASFSVAFFGFFRVGEITACKNGDTNLVKILSRQDITIDNDALTCHLRFSKGDQLGGGQPSE